VIRVVIPDIHGVHASAAALRVLYADIRRLSPREIVFLGDVIDAGGAFSTHPRSRGSELSESYTADCAAGREVIRSVRRAAPNARIHFVFGNHEEHIERFAARSLTTERDVHTFVRRCGPAVMLKLKRYEVTAYRQTEYHHGLSIPGTIRLGLCHYTHGTTTAMNAAAVTLRQFGANVVFGHTHRAQSELSRSVASTSFGAWCPGTLSDLQLPYLQTTPSRWTHGYAVQFVSKRGEGPFLHVNVPILNGTSLLEEATNAFRS
jgi:predicted phosphodiesterase